jgi:outer membrane lipoprotein SlyB
MFNITPDQLAKLQALKQLASSRDMSGLFKTGAGLAGGAIGTVVGGPIGGMIGSGVGNVAGDVISNSAKKKSLFDQLANME